MKHLTVIPIQEVLKQEGLIDTVNKYHLQIVHEDNDTYLIEDLRFRRTMTRGEIVHIAKTQHDVIKYLRNLRSL